jgi:hypothetical protein
MTTHRLRRVVSLVTGGVVSAAMLASCVHHRPVPTTTTSSSTTTTTTTTTTTPPAVLSYASAGTAAIRLGTSDRELVVTTTALPSMDAPTGCRAQMQPPSTYEEPTAVTVYLNVQIIAGDGGPGLCTGTEPQQVTVTLAVPLAGRAVKTARPKVVWAPVGDGTFRQCLRPACDPGPAEPAPTTTCSDGAAHRVESGGSLFLAPLDSWCQGPFGIVDFDWGNDICGPYPCPGQRTSRMFRQAVGGEWVSLQQHPYGGCGEILAIRPDFPVALCQHLPPLPGANPYGG